MNPKNLKFNGDQFVTAHMRRGRFPPVRQQRTSIRLFRFEKTRIQGFRVILFINWIIGNIQISNFSLRQQIGRQFMHIFNIWVTILMPSFYRNAKTILKKSIGKNYIKMVRNVLVKRTEAKLYTSSAIGICIPSLFFSLEGTRR